MIIKDTVERYVGLFMALWGMAVGFFMVIVDNSRFSSEQWAFIREAPGGPDTMGAILVLVSLLMLVGLWVNLRIASVASNLIGYMFICLALALGISAAHAVSGGVMGFPTFTFVGIIFLLYAGAIKRV